MTASGPGRRVPVYDPGGDLPPIARIHARSPRSDMWDFPDLWWGGPSPWPSMPAGHSADLPGTQFHAWRCCPDDGPTGVITDVEVHLPRSPLDFAFTVTIDMDVADMKHLVEVHGFGLG